MAEAITSEDSNSPEVLMDKKEAVSSYAKLLDSGKNSDVTIVVKGVEFHVHKLILTARYEYFENMFKNWKETEQRKITIEGVAPEVFEIVLEFIYKAQLSGWEEKLETYVDALIKASNMFGIDGLRNKCEKYLIRGGKINVENACKYFILADEHNAPKLKEAALEFLDENLEEVKKTEGYPAFKRHQTSGAYLLEKLSPSKRRKLSD